MAVEIKASEFKAKCLQLLDQVANTGMEIVITKHGRPVGKLSPYQSRPSTLFGFHKSFIRSHDDLTAPTGEDWTAERS